MSRNMPMDSITWALRKEPSAYCCASIAIRLACISGGLVARSLSQATSVITQANAIEVQPSAGLMRNSSTSITTDTGDSISPSSTGE